MLPQLRRKRAYETGSWLIVLTQNSMHRPFPIFPIAREKTRRRRRRPPVLNLFEQDFPAFQKIHKLIVAGASEMAELLHRRITKWMLDFFAKLCRFDYNECDSTRPAPMKFPAWCRLVFFIYIYLNVKLLVVLIYQYEYDLTRIELETLGRGPSLHNSSSGLEVRRHLESKLNNSKRILETLGNPYKQTRFSFACALEIAMGITYVTYLHAQVICVHLKLLPPLDFYFLRMMLSEPLEVASCRRLARKLTSRFCASSKEFVLSYLDAVQDNLKVLGRVQGASSSSESFNYLSLESELYLQCKNHLFVCSQLQWMLSRDQLRPINRSREWTDRDSLEFAKLACANLIYSLLIDLFLLFGVPIYILDQFELGGPMCVWFILEICLLFEISVLSTTFYAGLFTVQCNDQTRYILWVQEQIQQCISENGRLFAAASKDHPNAIRLINRNLIAIQLEFDVFEAQYRRIKRPFSFTLITITSMALLITAVIRLHLPYMMNATKSVGMYQCLVVVLFVDGMAVPVCRIYEKSKRTYWLLCNLLAQTVEFEQQTPANLLVMNGARVDQHSIWRLRNLILDQDKFMESFAAYVFFSIPMTTANLIKMHYWYSLVILSAYMELETWKIFVGERWNDPFQLLGLGDESVARRVDVTHLNDSGHHHEA